MNHKTNETGKLQVFAGGEAPRAAALGYVMREVLHGSGAATQ
jgi:hypothetical protein